MLATLLRGVEPAEEEEEEEEEEEVLVQGLGIVEARGMLQLSFWMGLAAWLLMPLILEFPERSRSRAGGAGGGAGGGFSSSFVLLNMLNMWMSRAGHRERDRVRQGRVKRRSKK